MLPRELLHSDGAELERAFEDRGLRVSVDRNVRRLLKRCLSGARIALRVEIVDRAGWHRAIDIGAFAYMIPGGKAFGPGAGRILLRPGTEAGGNDAFASAGTLAEWQCELAALAVGNDLLVLAIVLAFAGPLLDIVGMRSFGVHIVGYSQTGKTILLRISASIWGPPETGVQIRTWRATANGLEGAAAERNDNVLLLDEIGEADAGEVAAVVYLLGNNSGKTRADRTGAARAAKIWRLVYLSSGELDLGAKLGEEGKRVQAGQAVRMPTLPADAGAGLGVFQHLHGSADGAAFAHRIEALVRRLHGTAGPAFVEKLAALRAADPEGLAARLIGMAKRFAERLAPAGSDGQVSTLARNFGLLAAAGELAVELGVLPWTPGEATRAVETCLRAVLQRRGAGLGRAEDHAAIEQVRSFLERHGEARFQSIDADPGAPPVRDRAGLQGVARRWLGVLHSARALARRGVQGFGPCGGGQGIGPGRLLGSWSEGQAPLKVDAAAGPVREDPDLPCDRAHFRDSRCWRRAAPVGNGLCDTHTHDGGSSGSGGSAAADPLHDRASARNHHGTTEGEPAVVPANTRIIKSSRPAEPLEPPEPPQMTGPETGGRHGCRRHGPTRPSCHLQGSCFRCRGVAWWTERENPKGWRCSRCHPPAGQAPGDVHEVSTR